MQLPLADRIALVTGASRGIGYATALMLARAGAHVVAVARTVGGLEELDDAVRAAGGSATLVPLDMRDYAGLYRLAAALNERYGSSTCSSAMPAMCGVPSPARPYRAEKPGTRLWRVNVTANWHLIRAMDPLLKRSDAGRAVFITSGIASSARAYWAPYSVSKGCAQCAGAYLRRETSSTAVRVNLFNPGPVRTRMRALVMPGEDPMTLPTPEQVAEKIVDLCLPSFAETGKLYDYRAGKLLQFMQPA